MAKRSVAQHPDLLPTTGPLTPLAVYRRADLHSRFGGSRYKGIIVSSREPVILLFHTSERGQQFYEDGIDADGIYWYSGEGASGDMEWGSSNRAVRDHSNDGKDLLFFERAQRRDGLWRFVTFMTKVDEKLVERLGKDGSLRKAILFGLIPLNSNPRKAAGQMTSERMASFTEVRRLAQEAGNEKPSQNSVAVHYYQRSAAIRRYCLMRAEGKCEGCGQPAPFHAASGPFLEVHHLNRLADGGPDLPERVAALCPNCHRRCHHSLEASTYGDSIRHLIEEKEQRIASEAG